MIILAIVCGMEFMELKGIKMKQEKLTNAELENYRSFIIGLAMPAREEAGFVSCYGISKTPPPMGDGTFTLMDETESPDIIKLSESLVWLIEKFGFRVGTYRGGGDFIFGDGKDRTLGALLREHQIKIKQSTVLLGKDEQRPFMTLLPKITQAQTDGVIIIGDEMLLALRLKAEVLQNPANVQYGDSPALESLCYGFFGWRDLIRRGNQGPRQKQAINEP